MYILQEKRFEVWERRIRHIYDSPVLGDCQLLFKKKHGSYQDESEAKTKKQSLTAKYLSGGSWKHSEYSDSKNTILCEDISDKETTIWIQEKIVSEKIINQQAVKKLFLKRV